MRTEIVSFRIVSLLKFTGTIGAVNGILAGVPLFLLYSAAGAAVGGEFARLGAGFGLLVFAGVVLVSAVGGAITGLVTGLVYNIVSGMSGGVEVELEQKS